MVGSPVQRMLSSSGANANSSVSNRRSVALARLSPGTAISPSIILHYFRSNPVSRLVAVGRDKALNLRGSDPRPRQYTFGTVNDRLALFRAVRRSGYTSRRASVLAPSQGIGFAVNAASRLLFTRRIPPHVQRRLLAVMGEWPTQSVKPRGGGPRSIDCWRWGDWCTLHGE